MLHITGYQIHEQVYESLNSLVYRGQRENDGEMVILKVLKEDYPSPEERLRYRQEYEMTHSLALDGVIKAYSLEQYQHTLVIVFEDIGGQSLRLSLKEHPLSLKDVLTIAIQITDSLVQIHAANIIHKDLNPSNIVLNPPSGQLKLIDFGIATQLSRENPTIKHPHVLEGTLAYMSPEQTGRMNRSLDYRTDFYSLGVTLYELLTGQLPFVSDDALELVYCHLAKMPVSPHEFLFSPPLNLPHQGGGHEGSPPLVGGAGGGGIYSIPHVLSDIIMKLMSKTAEDRYQSAVGLKVDLQRCLDQIPTPYPLRQAQGRLSQEGIVLAPFELGQHDISGRFQIPEKLYGRAQETDTLLHAFERVSGGSTEMMLVTGYAGVGKSSLVHEVHTPITATRGYFMSGKFDQFQRNIPYSAMIQAFQAFVMLLLTEKEKVLAAWKEKILNAVGTIGKVLTDVFPNLELIIGKQPDIPEVGPAEAQNRFNLVFKNFVNAISQKDHPLVLFLDDMQWADSASLNLFNILMSDQDLGYFLLIGAYRDNEVSVSHPFMMTIDDMKQAHVTIETITVSNLSVQHVTELISDTMRHPEGEEELAELVYNKTHGNAFFIKQFLYTLYNEDIVHFDLKSQCWHWERDHVQHLSITENVVDLMTANVQKLPIETQTLLTLAACIGNRFDLETLAVIAERSLHGTAQDLHTALVEGLILDAGYSILDAKTSIIQYPAPSTQHPVSKIQFAHDRIQEAAYSLIPEEEKASVHLRIGNLLRDKLPQDQQDERIFDVINQLNWGQKLLESPDEMLKLADLNLRAGKKAKASTAYQPALRYFTIGSELLPEGSWDNHHTLTFSLHREWYECEYLTANFEEAEVLFRHILSHALSKWEQAEIYNIGIVQYTVMSRDEKALDIGREALKSFDIELPAHNAQAMAQRELEDVRVNLGEREIADLIDLPMMADREKQESIKLLMNLVPPSYVNLKNMALTTFLTAKAVNIAMTFGNTLEMSFGYGMCGAILRTLSQEYHMGDEFGKLAIQLSEKLNDTTQKCRVLMIATDYLTHWRMPIASGMSLAKQALRDSIESGVFQIAGYTFTPILRALTIQGEELGALRQQVEQAQQFANKTQNTFVHDLCMLWRQFIRNLRGKTLDTSTFSDRTFVEQRFLERVGNVSSTGGNFYTLKLQTLYLYEHYAGVLTILTEAEQSFASTLCNASVIDHNFYTSLTFTALYPLADADTQGRYREQLKTRQQQMKHWAEDCPENFLHKYCLIEAEIARIEGRYWEAVTFYRKAIEAARDHEFLRDEALANELLAKFWLAQGEDKLAQAYMTDAHYGYQLWGASGKMQDLEDKYPQLLAKRPPLSEIPDVRTTTSLSLTGSHSEEVLDFATVMKASHAISGEIVLDNLLSKMLEIVMQNAGAQKSYLILRKSGQWAIEAKRAIEASDIGMVHPVSIDQSDDVSAQIIRYVAHTQERVVLHDATHEGSFTSDPYIVARQPKSVLCLPLLHRGSLSGIVYLENNLSTGAFTPKRLAVLDILSSQMAISLENAVLYSNLERKVKERTIELEREISERKQAEEKIRQQHEFLEHTLESLTHPFYVIDPSDYTVTIANSAAKLGQLSEHSTCYALTHRNDAPCRTSEHPCPLTEVQNTRQPVTVEHIHYDNNGNARHVEVHAYPIFDQANEVVQVIEYSLDITERKLAEEELRQYREQLEELVKARTTELQQANEQLQEEVLERQRAEQTVRASEQQYRALAENVADGIAILRENRFVFVNKSLCSIFRYKENRFLQLAPSTTFHETYRPLFKERCEQLIQGHSLEDMQAICLTGDGQEIWTEVGGNLIEWEGKPAIVMTIRNITEQKLREFEMEQKRNHLQKENIALRSTIKDRYKFGEIIGKSPVMQEIYELIASASASNAHVTIFGESGTGKELIARTIHQLSDRRERAFVPVNCGAVPETLFESEFFGHRKGAFTGADRNQDGLFDRAHQGTLFLDEVGELSPILQVKLLRALELGEYMPLGSNTLKKVDVRIVAATNRNLEEQLQQGLMREDFFYRIHVVAITSPPLRDRKEDIPLLIDHFLEQYSKSGNRPTLPGHIVEALHAYDWPGNIRQLQNALQRYLTVKRLDFLGIRGAEPIIENNSFSETFAQEDRSLRETLDAYEKHLIAQVLEQNQGHTGKTAAMLDLPLRTLQRKIKKFNL